ncbi:hypothetical protein [Kiloniella sp.]|uniref:hypothetical protein n=1 Tax=Kiloniella sp. TaxID=1938587 RepID=UPI003B02C60B
MLPSTSSNGVFHRRLGKSETAWLSLFQTQSTTNRWQRKERPRFLPDLKDGVERQPLCPVASTTLAAFDAAVI